MEFFESMGASQKFFYKPKLSHNMVTRLALPAFLHGQDGDAFLRYNATSSSTEIYKKEGRTFSIDDNWSEPYKNLLRYLCDNDRMIINNYSKFPYKYAHN